MMSEADKEESQVVGVGWRGGICRKRVDQAGAWRDPKLQLRDDSLARAQRQHAAKNGLISGVPKQRSDQGCKTDDLGSDYFAGDSELRQIWVGGFLIPPPWRTTSKGLSPSLQPFNPQKRVSGSLNNS